MTPENKRDLAIFIESIACLVLAACLIKQCSDKKQAITECDKANASFVDLSEKLGAERKENAVLRDSLNYFRSANDSVMSENSMLKADLEDCQNSKKSTAKKTTTKKVVNKTTNKTVDKKPVVKPADTIKVEQKPVVQKPVSKEEPAPKKEPVIEKPMPEKQDTVVKKSAAASARTVIIRRFVYTRQR